MSANRYHDHVEEIVRVDATQPVEISVENQSGDVRVRGSDRADILIWAEKQGNKASAIYQETHFRIEADDTRILISPALPPHERGMPSVAVDLDLDLGADFVRDLLGSGRNREDREQRRQERRERRGRGFKFKWDNHEVSYEIEIEVPRALEYRLAISTASGDIDVRDMTGAIDLTTASGDAALNQIVGDIAYNTASGDLRIQRTVGQLTIRGASGDTRIERSAVNALGFHTASGDLHLDAALTGDGPYVIESVSGDTRLAVAALNPATGTERGLEILFQSTSGDARLDREFQRHGSGRWLVPGAEPGPRLAVTTVSGDLHGKLGVSAEARSLGLRAAPAAETPATPAVPPAPRTPAAPLAPLAPLAPVPEGTQTRPPAIRTDEAEARPAAAVAADRLALLEAVERGEIDIEEALQRLDDRKDSAADQE